MADTSTIMTVKLLTDLLKPVIDKLSLKIGDKLKLSYHKIFNSYEKYLEHEYERHSRFTSIVFKNEQKYLKDYYIPLTLVKQEYGNDKPTEEKIDHYPSDMINTLNKLLIVDTAGMGKSTLLKYLFINCVEEKAGIPIFVELRKLSSKKLLLDFIIEQLAGIDGISERSLVINLLESGEFIFFFDGYDEIVDSERTEVTANLQAFIAKAPENKYFITSRDEQGLIAFSDFQRFTIKPLVREEAFCLLRKYAENNLAETLISKLEQPEYENINEFLVNPLLTSLLYKSFEYKAIIPLKRHIFYRQVFEALYESHDLTKEGGEFLRKKRSNLDIDALEQVLRYVGYLSYKEHKVEYTKDELLKFIDKAKQLAALATAKSSDIIHDLTHAVPLMIEEGNYIRWAHRSIQEYFAALCLCRNMQGKQLDILLKYYRGNDFSSHINLVTLCADIEQSYFRQSIVKDILEKLLQEFNSIYQNMSDSINHKLIDNRKRLVVGKKIYVIKEGEFKSVIDVLKNKNIDISFGAAFIPRGKVEIIFVDTEISKAIRVLNNSQSIKLDFVGDLKYPLTFPTIAEYINNTEFNDFNEINDNQKNIVNQQEYFENINKILIIAGLFTGNFEFNEIVAQKLLNEINDEINAQQEFLDL